MKSKQIYIGNNIPGAVQRAQNNPTTTLIKLTYRFSFFPLFLFLFISKQLHKCQYKISESLRRNRQD